MVAAEEKALHSCARGPKLMPRAIAARPGPPPAQADSEGRSLAMRLAERHREPDEAHFTEGELDLEPPEELAVGELDDDAILEEELDNEDVLEQDVDEDTLEVTLEDLVHGDDGGTTTRSPSTWARSWRRPGARSEPEEEAEEDVGDDDLEESLDLVLLERMALVDVDGPGTQTPRRAAPPRPGGACSCRCGPTPSTSSTSLRAAPTSSCVDRASWCESRCSSSTRRRWSVATARPDRPPPPHGQPRATQPSRPGARDGHIPERRRSRTGADPLPSATTCRHGHDVA